MTEGLKRDLLIVIATLGLLILLTVGFVVVRDNSKENCNHKFEISSSVSPSHFSPGEQVVRCKRCGLEHTEKLYATVDLPQLYLDGNTEQISKTSECVMSAEYVDGAEIIKSVAYIKYQGHTSIGFEKKNFTIKFYKNVNRSEKQNFAFKDWNETHKFCLKANFIDPSAARNLVSQDIWRDVISFEREEVIEPLRVGIDGFPITLFINGQYIGLYTLNIAKDDSTYHIADDENEAMFVINSGFSSAANFKSTMSDEDKDAVFDLEYSYNNSLAPYESMDRLIDFVINNDGDDFREGIGDFLDVNMAIDYLITSYVLGLTDNFAKNMVLLTYDGQKWIPTLYDLDTAAGLIFDGSGYLESNFCLPYLSDGGRVLSGTENLLWDRILSNFGMEFAVRYWSLRDNVLSTERIISRYEEYVSSIPEECYQREAELYELPTSADTDQIQQISLFIAERAALLDEIINNLYRGVK